MSELPCATYYDLVTMALAWKASGPFWLGFGGSVTPWSGPNIDDSHPPQAAPGTGDIIEPLVFVKANPVTLCRPITQAEYDALPWDQKEKVGTQCYAFVADADAYDQFARSVFLRGGIDPSEGQPTGDVRQTGVFSGLVSLAGYENATVLLPEHVQSHGRLRWLDYDKKTPVSSGFKFTRKIVREMR
jgi:hypothetical protein